MLRKEFGEMLKLISNHKLYILAKKYLTHQHIGFSYNDWKCVMVQLECNNRNPKIFDDALKDSIIEANSIEGSMNGLKVVNIARIDHLSKAELAYYLHSAGAAKKNPVLDNIFRNEKIFKLSEENKENYFLCKVFGESMINANINDGDTLLVERNVQANDGNIIIASINGDLVVKRLKYENSSTYLFSENIIYPPLEITDDMNFFIFGIVRLVLSEPK
jgi:DNA polymerase V